MSDFAHRTLADRVHAVPPSGIRRFFDIAAQMEDIISLGVGEPDFDTPTHITEAAISRRPTAVTRSLPNRAISRPVKKLGRNMPSTCHSSTSAARSKG